MKRATLLVWFAGVATFSIPSLVAQAPDQAVHAPSGGTRMTVISISVPPLPHAPFTATVTTEWRRMLDDGSTVTIKNHRTIARDNDGRIFQERRNLYPEGDPRQSQVRRLEFADPRMQVIYYCWPEPQVCEMYNYFGPPSIPRPTPAGPLDGGREFLTRVDLGRDTVSGVETIGTRETTTITSGAIGNDRAIEVVKEFWYSQQLGINVIEKRQDPRYGTQTFLVGQISLGEPDARLFDMPPNFRTVDLRKTNQPAQPDAGPN
jgi:hypothetical protein